MHLYTTLCGLYFSKRDTTNDDGIGIWWWRLLLQCSYCYCAAHFHGMIRLCAKLLLNLFVTLEKVLSRPPRPITTFAPSFNWNDAHACTQHFQFMKYHLTYIQCSLVTVFVSYTCFNPCSRGNFRTILAELSSWSSWTRELWSTPKRHMRELFHTLLEVLGEHRELPQRSPPPTLFMQPGLKN